MHFLCFYPFFELMLDSLTTICFWLLGFSKAFFFSMKITRAFIWDSIYFCNVDGFFRILKKALSELICTRLYIQLSTFSDSIYADKGKRLGLKSVNSNYVDNFIGWGPEKLLSKNVLKIRCRYRSLILYLVWPHISQRICKPNFKLGL